MTYKAFISYSHADEKWAAWLHRRLENYSPPRHLVGRTTPAGKVPPRLGPIFRDREELASASDLGDTLHDALQRSEALIVICSPAAARSRWVNEEVLFFKNLGREHRIFSIIVDGEPGHTEDECFPPALKFQVKQGVVSQIPAEPIAADARTGRDGRRAASLKLIAGLLGVGFDDLQQRELHRKHQRLMRIAVASTMGMIVAMALMVTALLARNEAQAQRALAQTEAEKAQQTAAFLVDLFKVSDPGEARGRSITAREILLQGADNIETQLSQQPDIQASMLDTIGRVFISLGLFADAQKLLEQSAALRSTLLTDDQHALAVSQTLLANVYTESANYSAAEPLYQTALAALANNPEFAQEFTDTQAALAELYFRTGRYKDARPLLEQVVFAREQQLPPLAPKVIDAHAELALNYFDQGEYAEAETRLTEVLARQQRVFGQDPHPDIGETLNNLGLIIAESGRLDQAAGYYQQALQMNQALYGETHPAVAIGFNNLALLARKQGDLVSAEQLFTKALNTHIRLHGDQHPQVALVLTNLALTYEDMGESERAIDSLRRTLAIQRTTLDDNTPQVARTKALLGRLEFERGNLGRAEALQVEAHHSLELALEPSHLHLIAARINLAELYGQISQPDAARRILAMAWQGIDQQLPEDHWYRAWYTSVSSEVEVLQGNTAAGEALEQAYLALDRAPGVAPVYVRQAKQRLESYRQRLADARDL